MVAPKTDTWQPSSQHRQSAVVGTYIAHRAKMHTAASQRLATANHHRLTVDPASETAISKHTAWLSQLGCLIVIQHNSLRLPRCQTTQAFPGQHPNSILIPFAPVLRIHTARHSISSEPCPVWLSSNAPSRYACWNVSEPWEVSPRDYVAEFAVLPGKAESTLRAESCAAHKLLAAGLLGQAQDPSRRNMVVCLPFRLGVSSFPNQQVTARMQGNSRPRVCTTGTCRALGWVL